MAFVDDNEEAALHELKNQFPNARYRQLSDTIQQNALFIFTQDWSKLHEIKLHLKGTSFQIKVWEALLKVPMGELVTYNSIAGKLNNPLASRAVGSAVGSNPVAFLIPCHRVIKANGEFGNYHWGPTRKNAIIGWEASKLSSAL
jgi:AraC family transcriptional regulator of adaptative response/methylated-DNA-[protein]-cysteine methyltransferase